MFTMGQQESQRQNKPEKGHDLLMRMQIPLEEAVFGIQKELNLLFFEDCPECKGTGRTMLVFKKCPKCNGKGKIRIPRKVSLNIPAGIETGTELRLKGFGDAGGAKVPNGDLYIKVYVDSHPLFDRDGKNLVTQYEISPVQAILGCEIPVRTVDEKLISVKVPAGINYGVKLRIPGEGIRAKGGAGDLHIRIVIPTPKTLSIKERELYETLYMLENGGSVEDCDVACEPEPVKTECPADMRKFALDIVEVMDNLERALKFDDGNLREGLEKIHKFYLSVLSKNGIEPIDTVGKQFNPDFHEAISVLPSYGPDGEIIDVVVPGYMLHDTVLRYAKVTVSKNISE